MSKFLVRGVMAGNLQYFDPPGEDLRVNVEPLIRLMALMRTIGLQS